MSFLSEVQGNLVEPSVNYSRRVVVAEEITEIDKEFGEMQIAEYVVFLLALTMFIALWQPARTAARTDPALLLRED